MAAAPLVLGDGSRRPSPRFTTQALSKLPANVVDVQYERSETGPKTGSTQGLVAHGVSRIVCSSATVGRRQSQWPVNASSALPSMLTHRLSAPRNSVYAVPLGSLSPLLPPGVVQVYRLKRSCTLPSAVFCSHCRPVALSVTVPSPLSTKRSVVVVVMDVVVLVVELVLVVGVPAMAGVHSIAARGLRT